MPKKVVQAFVLAGGAGTRLWPLTHEVPKPLIKVHGMPLLEWNLRLLASQGIEEALLAIGYKAEKMIHHFGDGSRLGLRIGYVVEKKPLGTAGPLRLAAERLDETFFCMNADEITNVDLQEMAEFHAGHGGVATLYLHELEDVTGFGVAEVKGYRIMRFVEKPDPQKPPSHFINSGRYVFGKKILEFIGPGKQSLERDVFPKLAGKGLLCCYLRKGVYWKTINSLAQLKAVEKDFETGAISWLEKLT